MTGKNNLIWIWVGLLLFGSSALGEGRALGLSAAAGIDKPLGDYEPKTGAKLTLKGSRGEVLSFLIKVNGAGCGKLSLVPLKSAAGGALGAKARFYDMLTVTTREPSFPSAFVGKIHDPLAVIKRGKICSEAGQPRWLLGEIPIPRAAAPGVYRGMLRFGALGSVRVNLKVWRMIIPEQAALPLYAEMNYWYMTRAHFGGNYSGAAELAHAYLKAMHAHRIWPVKSAAGDPEVYEQDGKPYLDLYQTPTPDLAFAPLTLQDRPAWVYYDFPTVPYTDFRQPEAQAYIRGIENSLAQLERPAGRSMIFLWDEPTELQLDRLHEFSGLVRQLAPSLKIMVTLPGFRDFADRIDIFVPAMDYYENAEYASLADYQALRRSGHEVWWYVSCMSHGCTGMENSGVPDFVMDRPAAYIRSIAWLGAKYGIDGFLYYSAVELYRLALEQDPWEQPMVFTGNGDGTLFFPGRAGEHGLAADAPLETLRLKLWREASYDAEYLKWLAVSAQKPAWWEAKFGALVQSVKAWEKDYTKYRSLRDRIGAFVNAQQ